MDLGEDDLSDAALSSALDTNSDERFLLGEGGGLGLGSGLILGDFGDALGDAALVGDIVVSNAETNGFDLGGVVLVATLVRNDLETSFPCLLVAWLPADAEACSSWLLVCDVLACDVHFWL